MEVRERVAEGRGAERCPYCHDQLAADAEQVRCAGCGTTHHAVCLEELGRCTVMGCGWTPTGAPPRPLPARPAEVVRRAIAERTRRRVSAYAEHRAEGVAAGEAPVVPTLRPLTWEEEEERVRLATEELRRRRRQAVRLVVFITVVALPLALLVVVSLIYLLAVLSRGP